MDSVAHAEDSSSANADFSVRIDKIEGTSAGVLKVYLADGPSFFVRDAYLASFPPSLLESGAVLDEEAAGALLHAARVYLAERAAMEYLSRAEHTRFGLAVKLQGSKKGYVQPEVSPALDWLEEQGLLDDRRFASAWLRNRSIHQSEGRQKLLAGLVSRGVDQGDARKALEDYFDTADERALCMKAAEKLKRTGKAPEKMLPALTRKGFPSKMIVDCLKVLE